MRRLAILLVTLVAALGGLDLQCGDPKPPDSTPPINCDGEPASRPGGGGSRGELQAQLGEYTYTNGPPRRIPKIDTAPPLGADGGQRDAGGSDAGSSETGPSDGRGVTFSDEGWTYEGVGDEVEAHYGMQGGYHAQLALRVDGVEADSFSSVVKLQAKDPSSGEILARSICSEGDERFWNRRDGALYYQAPRLVFSAAAADVVGHQVEFVVDVQVGDRHRLINKTLPVE